MRDHSGLVVNRFMGDFDRGEPESTPSDYFLSSQNIAFIKNGVRTRDGSAVTITTASVVRQAIYEIEGQAKRVLFLDSTGHLYDSTDPTVAILTIAGMTDFSMVTIFSRAYITPHNGLTGLPGEKVYVYNGTSVRAAAGTPPSTTPMGATASASSGTIELGTRVYAVAFESASGFQSSPGGFVAYETVIDDRKTDISVIPTGPAGTVARILLATKRIIDFTGDFDNQTYYFVPNGRIANNTATTATIDFYDADLKDSANFLLEQLDTIPAGVGIALIKGRMAVWGEDLNSSIVRFSTIGEPESHNAVDGFLTVNPGDAGGAIRNCCETRVGQAIIFKSSRAYTALPTADPPAFWEEPIEIDSSVGTEAHGLARGLDGGYTINDIIFVVDRAGLRLYTGVFLEANILTYNIDDIWGRINKLYFHKVEIAVDPINFLVYITVPLDSETSPNKILVGDYSEGLSAEAIKWTIWSFPTAATSIVVQVISGVPIFKYGSSAGNIVSYTIGATSDAGTAIDSWVEFPYLPSNEEADIVNHFTGAKFRVKGSGTLLVTGKYPQGDTIPTFSGESIVLASAAHKNKFSGCNVVAERASFKARIATVDKYFTLTKFTPYVSPEWGDA